MTEFSTRPLMEMAGVAQFTFRWPTRDDLLAIDAACRNDASDVRFWGVLLHHICGVPMPAAVRIALAHQAAVAVMFRHAFREMRALFLPGDPRLAERVPAALADEVA